MTDTTGAPCRTFTWWSLCLVHNMLVHPLMPFADLLEACGERWVSGALHRLHDNTIPEGGG